MYDITPALDAQCDLVKTRFDRNHRVTEHACDASISSKWLIYLLPHIFVWAPLETFKSVLPPVVCPFEGCGSGTLSPKGWTRRWVYGLVQRFVVLCRRYQCSHCKKTVSSSKPEFMNALKRSPEPEALPLEGSKDPVDWTKLTTRFNELAQLDDNLAREYEINERVHEMMLNKFGEDYDSSSPEAQLALKDFKIFAAELTAGTRSVATLTSVPLFKQYAKAVVKSKLTKDIMEDSPKLQDLYLVLQEKAHLPAPAPSVPRKRKAGVFDPDMVAEAKRKDAKASGPCSIDEAIEELKQAGKPVTVDEGYAYVMERTGLPKKDMPAYGGFRRKLERKKLLAT